MKWYKQKSNIMRGNLSYVFILALLSSCSGSASCSAQEQKQVVADTLKTKKENKLDSTLNQKDGQGEKQGLWIEDNGLKEVYYLNGKKNGIYKCYFKKTGKLEALGEYENDKPTGNWYYFDESSCLVNSLGVIKLFGFNIIYKSIKNKFIDKLHQS